MPFRISKESKNWFKDIDGKKNKQGMKIGLDIDFDILYFCFMAGIAGRQKKDIPLADTNELVDYFPGRFKDKGRLMVALFLSAELRELGIKMNEKKEVHEEISKLVSPSVPSHLSDVGMREFNKYVYGGYDILLEWFDYRPQSLESFLLQFKQELDKNLQVTT